MISPATALNLAGGMMVVLAGPPLAELPDVFRLPGCERDHEPAQALDQPHHVVGWITTRASLCASVSR